MSNQEKDSPQSQYFEWSGREFLLKSGKYFDRSKVPLFDNYHNLNFIKKEVLKSLPTTRNGQLEIDKTFVPFARSVAPFWCSGIDTGAFNNMYAPFTVLYYTLRDHLSSFVDICDGVVIENKRDYDNLLNLFNDIFTRVLSGGGRGTVRGYCSSDEMIRMGTLFYLLQKSCNHSQGLQVDDERRFMNKFGGDKVHIDIRYKEFEQYSKKLEGIVMSDMNWKKFMMRYMENTDDKTLWLFNVPDFMKLERKEEKPSNTFTKSSFVEMIDTLSPINNRGGKVLVIIRKNDNLLDQIRSLFGFKIGSNDHVARNGKGLFLYKNFASSINEYSVISNYTLVR